MTLPPCFVKGCGKPARFKLSDTAAGAMRNPLSDAPICADCFDFIVNMLAHVGPPEENE